MHITGPLLSLLSVLPLLASATPEAQPAGGLVIKQVDLSLRKRQAAGTTTTTTGGAYVTSWAQCTNVCEGYFGKPVSSTPTANNAVVVTSTTKVSSVASPAASSVKPSTSTTSVAATTRATTTSSSTSRASTTSTSTRATTAATSSTRATSVAPASSLSTSSRASSAAISSARSTSSAPAATSAGTGGTTTTAAQRQLILDLHNAERRDYGASPLTWNSTLEKYAFDYASKCQWKHSQGPYGENLAASYGWQDALSIGIGGWNAERDQYNPQAPVYSHFTQVVWKSTSEVGCAMVKCPAGSIQPGWAITDYLVCEYWRPGNYAGQYAANVGTRVAA